MRALKLLFALLLLSLCSCGKFEEVNMGYPDVVKFSDNGGVETISVEDAKPFFSITIIDYNTAGEGMYYSNEGSGVYCEYEWLRVETEADNSTLMRVIAKPNITGEPRTLWIELYYGYEYHVIKVVQL